MKNIVKYTGKIDDIYRDSLLDESDLFILLRGDNKETRFSFPTRLPEYLLFNKPMIISPTLDFYRWQKVTKTFIFYLIIVHLI